MVVVALLLLLLLREGPADLLVSALAEGGLGRC